jgi:ABC-2 type transport system ATP-binding protein
MVKNDALLIKNIKKAYGGNEVLKGINLTIRKGSIFSLLGSNGAGKTTMVKILSTLIQADSGEAFICGYDIKKNAGPVRGLISVTGQYAAVDGLLTARENLRMIGLLFHVKNISEKVEELLLQFNLINAANLPVSTFSGGMRRRLDIAMSLIGNPDIIFLDEPTTGLDPQSRIEMWKVIRRMSDAGVTIFLTTQYIDEAEQLADHIAVLHQGKIIAQGSSKELKSRLVSSTILLGFTDQSSYLAARQKMHDYSYMVNDDVMSISIITDGSVKQLVTLLENLNGVEIAFLEQKQASLEDVFLTLVSK